MSWKPAGTSDTCLGVDCCLDRPRVLSPGAAAEEFPHLLIDDARLVINSTPLTQMQPKAGFTGVMWVETVEESSVWDGSAVVTVVTGVDGTSSAQLLIMPSYDSAYEVKIKKHMPLFVYCAMCTATHYGASGFRLQLRPGPCSYFSQRRDTIIDRCGLTTYNTACNVWSASAVALDNPCRVTADHFPLLNHGIGDVLDYAASAPQASVNVVLSGTIHAVGPAFRTSCGFVDLRCSRGSHTDPHRCTFMAGNTRQTTCDKCGVIDISGATYSLRVDIIDADGKRLENVRALTAAGNRIFNVADPMDYYVSTCIMSTAQREQHVAQLRQQVMGRKGIFALWRNGSKYFLCDIIFVSAPTPILHNQPSGPGTPGNSPAKKPRMR